MKFSIVTAVFNSAETIADTVTSVQSQNYSNIEHIIQDGGSSDGTLDVIRRLDSPLTKLVSQQDAGIYDAINKGISRATGDVIGLMHSDDFFAHDRVLERIAGFFDGQAIDGVYGDLDYVSASDTRKVRRHWRSGPYRASLLSRGWMPPHPTLYLRREVYDRWGLYDTKFDIAADYDAILRYLHRGNIRLAYIPEVLVKMRTGGESNRSLARILHKSREDYRAIRRNDIGGLATLTMKNASKLVQFVQRERY